MGILLSFPSIFCLLYFILTFSQSLTHPFTFFPRLSLSQFAVKERWPPNYFQEGKTAWCSVFPDRWRWKSCDTTGRSTESFPESLRASLAPPSVWTSPCHPLPQVYTLTHSHTVYSIYFLFHKVWELRFLLPYATPSVSLYSRLYSDCLRKLRYFCAQYQLIHLIVCHRCRCRECKRGRDGHNPAGDPVQVKAHGRTGVLWTQAGPFTLFGCHSFNSVISLYHCSSFIFPSFIFVLAVFPSFFFYLQAGYSFFPSSVFVFAVHSLLLFPM